MQAFRDQDSDSENEGGFYNPFRNRKQISKEERIYGIFYENYDKYQDNAEQDLIGSERQSFGLTNFRKGGQFIQDTSQKVKVRLGKGAQ